MEGREKSYLHFILEETEAQSSSVTPPPKLVNVAPEFESAPNCPSLGTLLARSGTPARSPWRPAAGSVSAGGDVNKLFLHMTRRSRASWEESGTNPGKELDQAPVIRCSQARNGKQSGSRARQWQEPKWIEGHV